jgi:hypothetical protein
MSIPVYLPEYTDGLGERKRSLAPLEMTAIYPNRTHTERTPWANDWSGEWVADIGKQRIDSF